MIVVIRKDGRVFNVSIFCFGTAARWLKSNIEAVLPSEHGTFPGTVQLACHFVSLFCVDGLTDREQLYVVVKKSLPLQGMMCVRN